MVRPATKQQKRFWALAQVEDASAGMNIPLVFHIRGELDKHKLEQVVGEVINNHESLRTSFAEIDGVLWQHVSGKNELRIKELKIDSLLEDSLDVEIRALCQNRFDLSTRELWAIYLVSSHQPGEYILIFVFHHIIVDGTSVELICAQISHLFGANEVGKGLEPTLQFSDYMQFRVELIDRANDEFWQYELAKLPARIDLPFEKALPAKQSYRGDSFFFEFNKGTFASIQAFSRATKTTPFSVMLAGLYALLNRYTAQDDLILCTDFSGRTTKQLSGVVGNLLNAIPVRIKLDAQNTFGDLAEMVTQKLAELHDRQFFALEEILEHLEFDEVEAQSLIRIVVLYQNYQRKESKLFFSDHVVVREVYGSFLDTSLVDIQLEFFESSSITIRATYSTDRFSETALRRILAQLERIVQSGLADVNANISDLVFQEESEIQVLKAFNDSRHDFNSKSVLELIYDTVCQSPQEIAIVTQSATVTYGDLWKQVSAVDNAICQHKVPSGSIVAVLHSRSHTIIPALLGIWNAGCAFSIIDLELPISVVEDLLNSASPQLLIISPDVDEVIRKSSWKGKVLVLSDVLENAKIEVPASRSSIDSQAYIIYTSGSTGKPKGVIVKRSAVDNYVKTFSKYFELRPQDVVLQQSPFSFDTMVEEIFPILMVGGRLAFHQTGGRDIDGLLKFSGAQHVTLISATPSLIYEINAAENIPPSLRILISGGEKLDRKTIDRLIDVQGLNIYNTYGPSESTVCVCYQRITNLEETNVIGRPLPNTSVYVIDTKGRNTSAGVKGEIHIGGAGLAEGYLNDEKLTSSKFGFFCDDVKERLFKTGDLGYINEAGELVFCERKDDQVKIRGYRVELQGVANVLEQFDGVAKAIVVSHHADEQNLLIAYYIERTEISVEKLRAFAIDKLPYYMIPVEFIQISAIPHLASGKIDTKALPAPHIKTSTGNQFLSDIEERLAGFWCDLLNRPSNVGPFDNFFAIGGQSIKVFQLINKISQEFHVLLTFKDVYLCPTIRSLSAKIETASVSEKAELSMAGGAESKLSINQQGLLFLSKFEESAAVYNISFALNIIGNIDLERMRKSIESIATMNEVLRTYVRPTATGPVLDTIASEEFQVDIECETIEDSKVDSVLEGEARFEFDLERGPLFRVRILSSTNASHWISFCFHHFIFDRWSVELFLGQLFRLYKGDHMPLVSRGSYAHFVEWQQSYVLSKRGEDDGEFWLKQFSTRPPALDVNKLRNRPATKSYAGDVFKTKLSADAERAIKDIASKFGVTVFAVLLTAFKALLCRYSRESDITIGIPVLGRSKKEFESEFGFYVNTLAVRTHLNEEASFVDNLNVVQSNLLDAFDHQDYPFGLLIQQLNWQRDLSRSPLFDFMFVFHHYYDSPEVNSDFETKYFTPRSGFCKYDLVLNVTETAIGYEFDTEYNTELFDTTFITSIADGIQELIVHAALDGSLPIGDLRLMRADQLRALGSGLNSIKINSTENLIERINIVSRQVPDKVALVDDRGSITYEELICAAANLARDLKQLSLNPGDRIAVFLKKSYDVPVVYLALLQQGIVFVPIDSSSPYERLNAILEDSSAKAVLSDRLSSETKYLTAPVIPLPSIDVSRPDSLEFSIETEPDRAAYILYTSGSTGTPKGVVLSHKNLNSFIVGCIEEFKADCFDVVLAATPLTFDLSIFEILFPLCLGKTIRIIESPLKIHEAIPFHSNILINTVPSVVETLLDLKVDFSRVKLLNMAGEPLPPSLLRTLDLDQITVRNLYGPTETTTYSTRYRFEPGKRNVLIGRPLANEKIYILDHRLQLTPIGHIGEIYIGGEGVSQGYLNKPRLTAKAFVNNPFEPNGIIYKTGDLGAWTAEGELQHLGRVDRQIKLLGFRIELPEIENVISSYRHVEKAVCICKELNNGQKILVAHVMTEDAVDAIEIILHCRAFLPSYMVPHDVVFVDEFPVTSNGKIDFQQLNSSYQEKQRQTVEKGTSPLEERLSKIWCRVLELGQIGIDDDFFLLGGNSLKAMNLAFRFSEAENRHLPLKMIFQHPTIRQLAVALEVQKIIQDAPIEKIDKGWAPSTILQQQIVQLEAVVSEAVFNMPVAYEISSHLHIPALEQSFQKLVERHSGLRSNFTRSDGEYRCVIRPVEETMFMLNVIQFHGENSEAEQEIHQRTFFQYKFDLENDLLIKADLIFKDENKFVLLFNIHHAICDGISMTVIKNDLLSFYTNIANGKPLGLDDLPIDFCDYAWWLREQHASENVQVSRLHWERFFGKSIRPVCLPADFESTGVRSLQGKRLIHHIDDQIMSDIESLSRSNGYSVFVPILAAVNMFIHQMTGANTIVTGIPVSGRIHKDLEKQVGLFASVFPFLTTISSGDSFDIMTTQIHSELVSLLTHQYCPIEYVKQTELDNKRRDFEITVSYEEEEVNGNGSFKEQLIEMREIEVLQATSKYQASLFFRKRGNQLTLDIEYDSSLFSETTIGEWAERIDQIMIEFTGLQEDLIALNEKKYSDLN